MPGLGLTLMTSCVPFILALLSSGDGLFNASYQPKRIKKKKVLIKARDGHEYLLEKSEITYKDSAGGWISEEHISPMILKNGTKITSHLELQGACYFCNELISVADARICDCGRLICFEHAKFDDHDQRFYCIECHKKLRRKRIILGICRFLISPFIEKVDDGRQR